MTRQFSTGEASGHHVGQALKTAQGGPVESLWLVVAREELGIDLNALSRQIGALRFSFATPETMVAASATTGAPCLRGIALFE